MLLFSPYIVIMRSYKARKVQIPWNEMEWKRRGRKEKSVKLLQWYLNVQELHDTLEMYFNFMLKLYMNQA